jgi:SP family arabinose:H+ symporter-like MFS transporter
MTQSHRGMRRIVTPARLNRTISSTERRCPLPIETPTLVKPEVRGSAAYSTLISMVAALGAVMFGFDIAIVSGAAPFLQVHFALNDIQFGWSASSLLFGCMIGALGIGRIADRFGRKRTLIAIALVFAVTSVLSGIAPTFTLFVSARIAGGLAVGAASMVAPLYIAEAAPYAIRGRMVALNQLGITFGIAVSYLINYVLRDIGPNNWRWMFATGAIPSVAFFVLLFVVPESPRWLFHNGRRVEAEELLIRLGGSESARRELTVMNMPQSQSTDLWRRPNRRVMIVGILLAALLQFSGINTVIEYAPIILRSGGNSLDTAIFQTFIIGLINFLATFVALFTVDRLGRRFLYIAGSCGMTVCLIGMSIGFATGHMHGIIGLLLILAFILCFASCIGPVFWILMAEIFPSRIRGIGMSIAVFVQWASDFVVVLLFPSLLKLLGGALTFGLLALIAFGMIFVAWTMIPETTGKTLEQIEQHWV